MGSLILTSIFDDMAKQYRPNHLEPITGLFFIAIEILDSVPKWVWFSLMLGGLALGSYIDPPTSFGGVVDEGFITTY